MERSSVSSMQTDCAVMPSSESIGRSTTESGRPQQPKGISTTGNCHTFASNPLDADISLTTRSTARSRSIRSFDRRDS